MVTVVRNVDKAEPAADDLAQLIGEAEQLGADDQAGAPGAAGEPAAPPKLTNAQAVAMSLQIIRETLCVVVKVTSPKQTMSDATLQAVGDAVGPVLDKYNVNLADAAGDYMAELRALAVVVPIAIEVRSALLDELRARKAKPIEPDPAAPAAPGAPAVDPAAAPE